MQEPSRAVSLAAASEKFLILEYRIPESKTFK